LTQSIDIQLAEPHDAVPEPIPAEELRSSTPFDADAPAIPASSLPPDLPLYRLSVAQYDAMVEAGIIDEDDNVELLEGILVQKMGKNAAHSYIAGKMLRLFLVMLPETFTFISEQPAITNESEPEPDGFIVRGVFENFKARHPMLSEIALVIEVADSTVRKDRKLKGRIYARAGIPVFWIVNVKGRAIEVYTMPVTQEGISYYDQHKVYRDGASVPLVLDGNEAAQIAVADVLP